MSDQPASRPGPGSPSPIYQFRIDQMPDVVDIFQPLGLSFSITVEYSGDNDPIWKDINNEMRDYFQRKGLHIRDANWDADFYKLPWVLLHASERPTSTEEYRFNVQQKVVGTMFNVALIRCFATRLPNHASPDEFLVVLGTSQQSLFYNFKY